MPKDFQPPDDAMDHRDVKQPEGAAPPKVSSRGMRAMQGEQQPTEAADRQDPAGDGKKAETTAPPDALAAPPAPPPHVPPETAGQPGQMGTDVAREKARQAAEQALVDKGVAADRLLDARRHASEAAARATLGGDATILDDAAENLGMKGNNYPTYDISSSNQVASVKTHWADDGSLSDSARQAYQRDFSHMLGWGRWVRALEQDGQNIISAREAGVPVPAELATAGPEQASQYLRDKSVLMVPDDHVAIVRADLRAKALELPDNYFLPSNPTEEQISQVLSRVRGIGMTSQELQAMIAKLEK